MDIVFSNLVADCSLSQLWKPPSTGGAVFFCITILLVLLKNYNRPTKMLLIAAFCANFERIYLSFFNIMKKEINNKLVVGLSFTQPSLV